MLREKGKTDLDESLHNREFIFDSITSKSKKIKSDFALKQFAFEDDFYILAMI